MAHSGSVRQFTAGQAQLGAMLLMAGLLAFGLSIWENSGHSLPWPMPSFWYSRRDFCLLVALAVTVVGGFVVLQGPKQLEATEPRRLRWRASRNGQRFQSIVMYSREECPLCDEAAELLQLYHAYLPATQEVDIDCNPMLLDRWNSWVPVIEIDGRVRFKGRVSELLLRRLIEGTPPV